jgi:hypothetical protein
LPKGFKGGYQQGSVFVVKAKSFALKRITGNGTKECRNRRERFINYLKYKAMLENIINSVKGQLTGELQNKFNLNPTQADQSVDLAKENVQAGLQKEAAGGDVSGIMNMLKGQAASGNHPAVAGMVNNYVSQLTTKLGLPAGVASQVGPFVIQFIMGKLSGKAASGEMNQNDLMGMLGGGLKDKLPGGLGDKLGGMFK